MSYIVGMNDASAGRIGNKAQRLAELRRVGFDVPAFFVVTPDAFAASLDEDQRRAFAAGQYDFLESLVVRSRVLQAIAEALDSLCADVVLPWSGGDGDRARLLDGLGQKVDVLKGIVFSTERGVFVGPQDAQCLNHLLQSARPFLAGDAHHFKFFGGSRVLAGRVSHAGCEVRAPCGNDVQACPLQAEEYWIALGYGGHAGHPESELRGTSGDRPQ